MLFLNKQKETLDKSGQNGDIENERGRSRKRQARGIVLVTHIIAAVVKIIGFLFSGSAVLMNESIHSVIDCLNQGLLAIGENEHGAAEVNFTNLVRARDLFFSTVVAMTVFSVAACWQSWRQVRIFWILPTKWRTSN